MKTLKYMFLLVCSLLFLHCKDDTSESTPEEPLGYTRVGTPARTLAEFETVLERVRTDLKIPGFSAAITKNRRIVWARGFGYSNRERAVAATSETVYHLASLTKPFAATLIMQLAEENRLSLDNPISQYGINLGSQGVIRVRHLLSHTSEGIPGSHYQYNGGRFAHLDAVIAGASGTTFCQLLRNRILVPVSLSWTAPFPLSPNDCMQNYQILDRLAQGYSSNGQKTVPYQTYFGSSAGLVSTVIDMSRFSIAFDNNELVSAASKTLMFTPARSNSGSELPYGLGWFIDNNESVTIVWHYGYWDAVSTLIMKIPERELSFVVLANTDRLSSASQGIGTDEDVNRSVVAQEFLNAFVYGTAQLPDSLIH